MNDEAQIGFVESHPKRDCRDQRLNIIFQQQSLRYNPFAAVQIRMVRARDNPLLFQKGSNAPGILNGQRVNDSIALESWKKMRQPRHSFRLIIELDVEQFQRTAHERAAENMQ